MTSGVRALGALRPRACLPPMWHEVAGLAAFAGPRSWRATRLRVAGPRGPVVLVPGLLAGDGYLSRLQTHLRHAGHPAVGAGISCNVDCSEAAVRRLLERVAGMADRHGEAVTLVGHSRGGLLARVAAQRRPGVIAGVVMLGSPHRDQLAVHPLVWAQILAVAAVGSVGLPGLFRVGCAIGTCCKDFSADLASPPPPGVGMLSVYSRRDGVVDWRACIDEHGDNVEVRATHCGMAVDPDTFAAVAEAAERFAAMAAPGVVEHRLSA